MSLKKQIDIDKIKIFYLIIFFSGIVLIAPTHIFPIPAFMYARFPHYLEMMGPFFGISWPTSFEIYHYVLYLICIILSLNVLGIIFYPKFKKLAVFSSTIGTFLFSLIILFFFFVFLNFSGSIPIATPLVYGSYFMTLLILDILTLKVLTKGRKEA